MRGITSINCVGARQGGSDTKLARAATIPTVRFLVRATAIAGALSLTCIAACSSSAPVLTAANTIRIGVDLPLSGAEGQAGNPALNGVRFFVRQHPTVNGFNVVVSARDDAFNGVNNPDVGVGNVQTFIADPQVLGMVGP